VPRITDQRREARREQILEAARACLQDHGLEAVSMETIIARSGLSTGAVYGYFKGKDEIINAAVVEGTAALARELAPILRNPEPPPPPELLEQVLQTIVDFGRRKGGIDRLLVAIHGWSHSQSNPKLKATTRTNSQTLRRFYAEVAEKWRASGAIAGDPNALAELLTSITLGFVAQRALAGGADVAAHVDALGALLHESGAASARPTATTPRRRSSARRRSTHPGT